MKKKIRIYLSIASGILLALSFPPMPTYLLGFICFVPLLFLLDNTKKFYFWNTYLTFFIFNTATLWWISSFQEKTDPFLMISGFAIDLFHPLFFMIPIIFWLVIRVRLPRRLALYLFPFVWATYEWSRSLTEFSFPWLSMGYTQIYNTHWVQIADIFGVFGTSLIIVLFNVTVYDLIYNYRSNKTNIKDNKMQYSLLFLIIALPIIYSNIQINHFDHKRLLEDNKTINIGLVQPNIDPWDKWSGGSEDQLKTMMKYTDNLLDSTKKLDLVIWPETSILYLNTRFNIYHDFGNLKKWVDSNNIAILSGLVDIVIYEKGEAPSISKQMFFDGKNVNYDNFNSAILLDSEGYQIYHKMKLTPFGERVPHVEIFTFLTKFIDWGVGISFWGKGTEQKNLYMDKSTIRIAPIICIESIYPSFVKDFSYKGANLFTVMTNDAWYDHTPGPEQHALISAFRAIENKKYVARAANSGVTCFISPLGKILSRAEQYKQSTLSLTIPLVNSTTLYSIYGNWIIYFSFLISIFFILYAIFKKD